ncbi:MAG: hypothetical protein OXC13_15890 [Caldilineaceae bacterium]|nr:hypothetical protein [Caldilineaceae bacterium]
MKATRPRPEGLGAAPAETPDRCLYEHIWTNRRTGERRAYTCGREIEPDQLPPHRHGHQVCHRHERGLDGLLGGPWDDGWPTNPDGCAWRPVRSTRKGRA